MYRKQIANDRIANSQKLTKHIKLIKNVAQTTSDPEDFYDWLIKTDEKFIIDWTEDAQLRDAHGYIV